MNVAFASLLVLESVLTAAAVLMFAYRGMLDMKEEDRLILDDAEAHLGRGQAVIRQRVGLLSRYLKFIGIAWIVLGVVLFAWWVVMGLNLI